MVFRLLYILDTLIERREILFKKCPDFDENKIRYFHNNHKSNSEIYIQR